MKNNNTVHVDISIDDIFRPEPEGPVALCYSLDPRHFVFDVTYAEHYYQVVFKDGYFHSLEPLPESKDITRAIIILVETWFQENGYGHLIPEQRRSK